MEVSKQKPKMELCCLFFWFVLQYVHDQVVEIQETANHEVAVEVDRFQTAPGIIELKGGLFKGKSLVYSGLEYVVVRVHPKYDDDALKNAILVSSHVDTVITAEGAGDCSSCVGVMLELARAVSHWAQGFKHSVIFLFNAGKWKPRIKLFLPSG
jgi:hypothetical protein